MEGTEELKALKEKFRALALFFYNSPKMSQCLREEQEQDCVTNPLAVILDVPTRWNSTYHMLSRLLALRAYIEAMPLQLDDKTAKKLMELIPKSDEWDIVSNMLRVLKPFDILTDIFSSSQHGMAAMIGPRAVGLLRDLRHELRQASDLPDKSFDMLSAFKNQLIAEVKS
jgi:hypothetical protein